MPDGQASLNPHLPQHVQRTRQTIQRGQGTTPPAGFHTSQITDDIQLDSPSQVLMDHPTFHDFAFPFEGLPEQPNFDPTQAQHAAMNFQDPSADPFAALSVITTSPNDQPPPNVNVAPGQASLSSGVSNIEPGFAESPGGGARDETSSPAAKEPDDGENDGLDASRRGRADGTDLGVREKDGKGDAAPAWSELKTKAGKERKRLPLACIACRRKKIRCSGEKPACKHCLRSRLPCVYKVTTRKAAPRTDYMAMLDKRLKRMEERIIKVVPDQEPVSSISRAVVKPAIPGTLAAAKATGKKRGVDEAFGNELEAWAKASSKSKMKGEDVQGPLPAAEADEDQLLREGLEALPSKEMQERLAEVFFDNVYGQAYYLLHKPSYMRKLRNDALPPVLVLSVCAISARFAADQHFSSTTRQFLRGEEWASQARDICTRRYEWPNITVLTCLLILGLHEFGTCQGGRSWALGGQAIRMAFALQLHKDLDHDPIARGPKKQLSFIDREIRRRIMWACFLMDRFNSSGAERPLFIRESTIKIPLPVRESFFQKDLPVSTESLDGEKLAPGAVESTLDQDRQGTIGIAAYMIRAISIWGRIIQYLNQGGNEGDQYQMWDSKSQYASLLAEAESFPSKLPELLRYSPDQLGHRADEGMGSQFLLLHIAIQQNILFLHRSAVACHSAGTTEAPQQFISAASGKAFAAANQISELLNASDVSGHFVSAPFAGYCAFSSATIHILAIFSGNASVKATAEANAGINIKFLRKMMKYWGMFHWMVDNVRSQYSDALDAARNGTANVHNANTSSILQYGDWFAQYPHGVNENFLDPAKQTQKEKGADGVLEPKPELQSVEEFFSSLSPSQNNDAKEAARGPAPTSKRKATAKKQNATAKRNSQSQAEIQAQITDATGNGVRPSMQEGTQAGHPQPVFPSAAVGQPNPPVNYTGLSVSNPGAASYGPISRMSPVAVNQFQPQGHGQQAFYPQDMMPANMGPQLNGVQQSMTQQMNFGNYGMNAGHMAGNPNMMDGMSWHGMPNPHQQGIKLPMNGNPNMQGRISRDSMAHLEVSDSGSGWFLPYNVEPPPNNADMSVSGGNGNVDTFGTFSNGSGMTTPGSLGGVRHTQ